jgi:pilus assembly protein Flp/PilA
LKPIRTVGGAIEGRLGTLVSTTPMRLLDISRTGCLLETSSRVEAGATGNISVDLEGRTLTDDVRITRCQRLQGSNGYHLGAEFLRTRRPCVDSLSVALAAITTGTTGASSRPRSPRAWAMVDGSTRAAEECTMKTLLRRFVHGDSGQDLIEYALLAAFIALAAILGMKALGTGINGLFQSINTELDKAKPASSS